jgi:hypothetical protein
MLWVSEKTEFSEEAAGRKEDVVSQFVNLAGGDGESWTGIRKAQKRKPNFLRPAALVPCGCDVCQ